MLLLLLLQLICWFHGFGRNLNGGLLVHTTVCEVAHFHIALAHNIFGGVVPVVVDGIVDTLDGLQTTAHFVSDTELFLLSTSRTDMRLESLRVGVGVGVVIGTRVSFDKQVTTGQGIYGHIHES